jgi:hypothetical protein
MHSHSYTGKEAVLEQLAKTSRGWSNIVVNEAAAAGPNTWRNVYS